jgi:hypothetical protein
MRIIRFLAAVGFLGIGSSFFAQTMLNYVDPSADSERRSRRSTANSGTGANAYTATGANARATPTPKASPSPTGTKKAGLVSAKAGATTGTLKGKATPAPAAASKAPAAGAASGSFAQSGLLKEVTKEMAESIRTRKVDFDPDAAAQDPAVILLNPRKLNPEEEKGVKTDSLARPL